MKGVWLALGAIAALSWLYLIHLSRTMPGMAAMPDMPGMTAAEMAAMSMPLIRWTTTDIFLTILMWIVMMMAMMLPSAAPAVQLFALTQSKSTGRRVTLPTTMFVGGYAVVWIGFSVA